MPLYLSYPQVTVELPEGAGGQAEVERRLRREELHVVGLLLRGGGPEEPPVELAAGGEVHDMQVWAIGGLLSEP